MQMLAFALGPHLVGAAAASWFLRRLARGEPTSSLVPRTRVGRGIQWLVATWVVASAVESVVMRLSSAWSIISIPWPDDAPVLPLLFISVASPLEPLLAIAVGYAYARRIDWPRLGDVTGRALPTPPPMLVAVLVAPLLTWPISILYSGLPGLSIGSIWLDPRLVGLAESIPFGSTVVDVLAVIVILLAVRAAIGCLRDLRPEVRAALGATGGATTVPFLVLAGVFSQGASFLVTMWTDLAIDASYLVAGWRGAPLHPVIADYWASPPWGVSVQAAFDLAALLALFLALRVVRSPGAARFAQAVGWSPDLVDEMLAMLALAAVLAWPLRVITESPDPARLLTASAPAVAAGLVLAWLVFLVFRYRPQPTA